MVGKQSTAVEAGSSGSDEVHVNLAASEQKHASSSEAGSQVDEPEAINTGALLTPVAKERAVKIEWCVFGKHEPCARPLHFSACWRRELR